MGKRGGDVEQNRGSSTSHVLVPSKGNAEQLTGFKVGAPEFQEEGELTQALFDVESTHLDPTKCHGTVDDRLGSVAVVSNFGEHAARGTTLDQDELGFGEITYWERIGDTGEVNRVIERPAFVATERTASNNRGFLVTVFGDGSAS